jgi:hypothetical protein
MRHAPERDGIAPKTSAAGDPQDLARAVVPRPATVGRGILEVRVQVDAQDIDGVAQCLCLAQVGVDPSSDVGPHCGPVRA